MLFSAVDKATVQDYSCSNFVHTLTTHPVWEPLFDAVQAHCLSLQMKRTTMFWCAPYRTRLQLQFLYLWVIVSMSDDLAEGEKNFRSAYYVSLGVRAGEKSASYLEALVKAEAVG